MLIDKKVTALPLSMWITRRVKSFFVALQLSSITWPMSLLFDCNPSPLLYWHQENPPHWLKTPLISAGNSFLLIASAVTLPKICLSTKKMDKSGKAKTMKRWHQKIRRKFCAAQAAFHSPPTCHPVSPSNLIYPTGGRGGLGCDGVIKLSAISMLSF